MSRLTLISLTGAFVLAALAVALIGGAEARSTTNSTVVGAEQDRVVERCSLQPQRVAHPDNGAPILVLRTTCQ